jgi:ribonuclease E
VVAAEAGVALPAAPLVAGMAVSAMPEPVEPIAVSTEPVTPSPLPAPLVQATEAAEPYLLPVDDLAVLASAAGLQWVQSDSEKVRTAQALMAAEPPPIHIAREPRRQVLADEGPLVLVETRKDLSQMKLPFDPQAITTGH